MPDALLRSAPILVVGAAGQVGTQLIEQLGADRAVGAGRLSSPPTHLTGVPWLQLDLERLAIDDAVAPRALSAIPGLGAVICVAALTDVDRCEREPALAMAVNADGSAALAAATPPSIPFVYFSTEYVFDGGVTGTTSRGPYTEDSPTHAISAYGRSKLRGEELVRAIRPDALIVRTTVVYGVDPARKNFLYFLHRQLSAGQTVRVVTDQVSTPTVNIDLATATLALLAQQRTGTFHVCGPELLTRFEFAVRAARLLGLDDRLIQPITTASLQQCAPRPLHAGLLTDKLRSVLGENFMSGMDAGVAAWAHRSLATV